MYMSALAEYNDHRADSFVGAYDMALGRKSCPCGDIAIRGQAYCSTDCQEMYEETEETEETEEDDF